MDFIHLYHRILNKWWVVASAIAFCTVLALVYLSLAQKVYSSQAVIQVQQEGGKLLGTSTNSADDSISPEVLKTIEQSLTSQSLLLRVIHAAHLGTDPKFAPPKRDGAPYLDSELIEMLQSKLSVELRRGTRLIDVVIEDRDPERAQRLVQTLVSQYLEQSFERQLASLKASNDYLSDEVRTFWADLPRIREALDKSNPSGLLEIASISQDAEVSGLQTRIHAEEADFASLKEVFMENHPRYIAAQRRLQELQEAQQAALLRAAERVENSYDNAKATEAELTDKLQQQEQAALPSDRAAIPGDVLTQEVESDRALYDTVLARMNQTAATQGVTENAVRVVEEPLVSAKPVRPRPTLVLAAAMLAGIVAGVGFIVVQDFFNSSFTSVNDVESSLGVPVLTAVPKSPLIARTREAMTVKPNSFETEAFRTLRTSIHLLESKGGREAGGTAKDIARNAVLFTSANPGEGKTSCAYNYAVMLSRQGLRTLLIDGDLRRATLTTLLMRGKKCLGLSEVLAEQSVLQNACHPTQYDQLFFLAAGGGNSGTAELLDSIKAGALLREAAAQFDRIVIDTPPINAVSDSLLIAPHVLVNCLVVHAGVTPKRAVARACLQLQQATRGIIGAILNQVGTDSRAAYECHGYAKNFVYTYAIER
jgi:succinoglycan biosynthesis transport protein ExoP